MLRQTHDRNCRVVALAVGKKEKEDFVVKTFTGLVK